MNRAFFLIFWGYIKDTWIARHFYPHVVGIAQVRASAKELGGWRTLNTGEWYRNIAQKSLKIWVHFMTYSPIIGELKVIIPFKPVSWARTVVFLDGPWPHFL